MADGRQDTGWYRRLDFNSCCAIGTPVSGCRQRSATQQDVSVRSKKLPINITLRRGAIKGWRGFVWMLKIILPVSFVTFLLDYSGGLAHMDGLLEPLMATIHLPAMAALPLLAGLLTGIYGAIAAMSVLPFTVEQMTLMAVFLLIAHSLIQEGLVQHQSGCPAWIATVIRLTAAVLTVWTLGWFLGPETVQKTAGPSVAAARIEFGPAMAAWGMDMAWLCLKILLIITALMIFMEVLRQYHIIDRMMRIINPLMGLLGLDKQVGMMWMTAAVFGITYGGAVIIEESREHRLTAEQLKSLHVSIGINHAVVEDPALFLPFGIHPFWLWIPRLVTAVVFTYIYHLWRWIKNRRRPMAVKPTPVDGH